MPAEIVSSNAWYTLVTNDLGTLIQVTQGVAWGAVTTNAWRGPGVLTSDHLQMLDALLLAVTPRYADTFFLNAQTNYNDWFAREAYLPFSGYAVTNNNLAACTLDDDWRLLFDSYDEDTDSYSGERGYYRVRMRDGVGELPPGNSLPPPGDFDIIVTPTNYPMLTPAAVGHRLKIGRVDLMETNGWGEITGGQFRFTKDWRASHGSNTAAWVLWEIAAAKAPYTWSGLSDNSSIGRGDGLLIPYWIDPYRGNWLAAYSSRSISNLWAEQAGYMRGEMDGGPYYISHPLHDVGTGDPGEYCTVIGRRSISNRLYWCQSVGYFNPPAISNIAWQAILIVPRGTNSVPGEEEPFGYADLANSYAPARLLTRTGSETNAFWARSDDGFADEFYRGVVNTGDNLIAPATNRWYWRQWEGDAIPRRYVVTNEFPRYRTLSGDPSASGLPHLSGYSFDAPVPVDPALGQMLVECDEDAGIDAASAHHWRSVEQSGAWLCDAPTNPTVVRLEYAPAQTLYQETEGEPLTRLADLIISEREAYLDYLEHCVPAAAEWAWTNTQEIVTNAAASLPAASTNEGYNTGSTVAARWASSQAHLEELEDWIDGAVDSLLDGIAGLPAETMAALTNDAAWSDSASDTAPHAAMSIDHSMTLSASYRTTWWSEAYDPTSMGLSNYLAPWIGFAEPRVFFGGAVSPWPEYGTNTYLSTSQHFYPTFDWSYCGSVLATGPSSHGGEFVRSTCVVTSAPPSLDGLDAYAISSNHYGREAFVIGTEPWISQPYASRTSPVLPDIPQCLIPGADLDLAASVVGYDAPMIELLAGGAEAYLAENTNSVPAVTNWVAELDEDWLPVFEYLDDAYVVDVRSNEDWNVTINVVSNENYETGGGLSRPWIVTGFYVFEEQPVYLWTVTNNYSALYAHTTGDPDRIIPDDWDTATNLYYYTSYANGSVTYQSCTNLPHGSTTVKGQDGAVNCNHAAVKEIGVLASVGYTSSTNFLYFERQVMEGGVTNWLPQFAGVLPGSPVYITEPAVTNIGFVVWDWPGEWVTWTLRTGFSERTDYRTLWMGGAGGTGETFQAGVSAGWDYLAPLFIWNFRKLRE